MCLFKINFYIYLVYTCVCVCVCIWDPACHSACVEVKRQLKELVFSFNHVVPGTQSQVNRRGGSYLYQWSHPATIFNNI